MAFAVLERLMQRHLMAQAPVDISKPGMMLLNNLFGLIPCSVLVLTYQASAVCGGQFLCNGGGSRHLVCELLWLLKLQSFACSQEVPRWPSVVTHLSVGKWLLITASCVNGLAISYAVPQRCPCYSTRIFCLCFARLTSFHQTKISPKSHFAHFSSPPRCANLFRHTAVFVPPMVNVACLFRVQGLRVQQLVTATTFMVLTNVNKFVVIFFGVVALHDPLTARAAFGVLLAMGGGVWYAQARAHAPEPAKKQQVLPLSAIKL
uniref:Sugar phosphate transporter domain-containing protein n=3 Tax=Haptolina ericina TaxID=156174 RepID=A0A7S3AHL9_9EUKA|mmetsp:Transcript_19060/g.42587  ORF Transcript_19060/g.42587 Transcript_19060/m.42587 type:complete len:262 (+) Transcript_19060:727-1512(+)